ncbi:hypothetical protein [Paraburkholderia phenoliruptrix]|uniref:hypothetical protein n=1 Tax=Paraburkholderia phenoliruptrix TaxID=252970 RepID=UPI0034CE9922
MMNSSELCAGLHQGEPRVTGFYSCASRSSKTFLRRGIKRLAARFARLAQRVDRTIKKLPNDRAREWNKLARKRVCT